ncbi:MAG: hypothetical protein ACTSXK_13710 [Promethearchaeota archaeon]
MAEYEEIIRNTTTSTNLIFFRCDFCNLGAPAYSPFNPMNKI